MTPVLFFVMQRNTEGGAEGLLIPLEI